MRIEYASLETCASATDTVVVIDVCRAFTTAAFAFAAGARDIILVSTVDEAFSLRERFPGALAMGEVGGLPVEGFDYGNSPHTLIGVDLAGRRIIQRTSAGTQGVVRSVNADILLASSFVCAGATARYIKELAPASVTFVITGMGGADDAGEDLACAEYIAALLTGRKPDVAPYLKWARNWPPKSDVDQTNPTRLEQLHRDRARCLEVDRFDFALPVSRRNDLLAMEAGTMYGSASQMAQRAG